MTSNASVTISGPELPNIPWEDKPAECREPLWRYSRNPIIRRDAIEASNSIFNSAVVPFGDGYAGVFRVDHRSRRQMLHAGFSDDGMDWRIEPEPIQFQCDIPALVPFEYGYDPRVCYLDGKYWVTWCNGLAGQPTIGMAWTEDFRTFQQTENAHLPFNRNGVLFPRTINGRYAMLSRPSDAGHTPFGDIFYSESPDMEFWGRHRLVMESTTGWQATKIGAGPIPLETSEGWLLLYHGVLTSCNGFVYSIGGALLDREEPWKVLYRTEPYLLAPWELYECVGDVPNVIFPCAMLADSGTGRLAVYYGGADTVVCVAFAMVDDLVCFIRDHSKV